MTKDVKRITYLEKQIGKFKSISIRRKVIIERLEARIEELEGSNRPTKIVAELQELLDKANTFESFDIKDKDYCMTFRLVCADLKGILERAKR